MSKVMIVTVPAAQEDDLFAVRDYIRECLQLGVLILGKGVSWEVAEIPELGGLIVEGKQTPLPECTEAATEVKEETTDALANLDAVTLKPRFMGPCASEKREIHDRLVAYRKARGLGSFAPLIAASKGQLSDSDMYRAVSSEPIDVETWRRIGRALDSVEG